MFQNYHNNQNCKCLATVYREASGTLRYTSVCAAKQILLGCKAS